MPNRAELGRFGVARVSIATRPAALASPAAHEVARELRSSGRLGSLEATLGHADMQRLTPSC